MMAATLSALGEAAIAYARIGWKVFPLAPGGKEPLISQRMGGQGFKDGTTDEALIRKWWSATPDANIGMWPGGSGLVVVDPDLYKPDCGWAGFIAGRDLPDTLVQITPRGGHHYFFDAGAEPFHGGTLCKSVDVRFSGYVVLAPSTVDGSAYMWFSDDPSETGECPAAAPDWIPRKRPEPEPRTPSELASDDTFSIFAAVRDIPNPDLDWEEWNRIGMAVWAATSGSPAGRIAFHEWSKLSLKYSASETDSRWDHYFTSPPGAIGAGTLFHEAAEARRGMTEWIERLKENMDRRAGVVEAREPVGAPVAGYCGLLNSTDFMAKFEPPSYLIDGMLLRGMCYSFTGPTGHGKTAIALLMQACVATGRPFGGRETNQGSVLFLAGENPDNVRIQWYGLCDDLRMTTDAMPVYWHEGAFSIDDAIDRLEADAAVIPDLRLIVADTLQAFFDGDDDNANPAMLAAARRFRSLSKLPSRPTVIVPAHPIKNARRDNLTPRGGSAFLNEIDGNVTIWTEDGISEIHHGKLRGAPFDPMKFQMARTEPYGLIDERGRQMPAAVARPLLKVQEEGMAREKMSHEDAALRAIDQNPRISADGLAQAIGCHRSTAFRIIDRLKNLKWIKAEGRELALTAQGRRVVDVAI